MAQALLPSLAGGCILALVVLLEIGTPADNLGAGSEMPRLAALWIILYGCALHAAGFFMPRGMKLFGWAFVLGGCGIFALGDPGWLRSPSFYAHGIMGVFFGALHLAYGIYLCFTDQGKNA